MHEGIILVFTWLELEDATVMTLQHIVMVGFHVVSDITLQLCHIVEENGNLKPQSDYGHKVQKLLLKRRHHYNAMLNSVILVA